MFVMMPTLQGDPCMPRFKPIACGLPVCIIVKALILMLSAILKKHNVKPLGTNGSNVLHQVVVAMIALNALVPKIPSHSRSGRG